MARILVVDDDALVRATIRLTLERAKHAVIEAGDGRSALAAVAAAGAEPVDLVVTDVIMPELDGIGLVTELRKSYPSLRIVAVSGGGRTGNLDYLRMAKALGAHAILPKPFTPEQLVAAVDAALQATPEGD